MSTLTVNKSNTASNLSFTEDKMCVYFEDGRELTVSLEWFPKLRNRKHETVRKLAL
jgi:hypothetical protein